MALIEKTLSDDLLSFGSSNCETGQPVTLRYYSTQKMKFSINDFFIFFCGVIHRPSNQDLCYFAGQSNAAEATHKSTENTSVATQAKISHLLTATSSLEYCQSIFPDFCYCIVSKGWYCKTC